MPEIKLIVSDAALRRLRSVLTVGFISGSQSPTAEPLAKIVKALEQGKSIVTLQLREEVDERK